MLPEFKKRIDTLRDILVGAVPSPAGQIEQITYALIYKFMSDIDDRSASIGGKRAYFTGEYERYGWHELMAPTLGAHDRLTLYREALGSLARNPDLPELFQGIYQNAYLTFNDPRVLTLFLKEIDNFKHSSSDDIGDAYEYLLQITGAQGDVGQFRTPRHIIKFIVEAVNPTKSDSVLDPAVGTAGFLIAAYNHVKHHHDGVDEITGLPDEKEERLTADELDKLHKSYHGFDIDPTMVRTAKVNMYLHGFTTPDIKNHDSLSSEDFWNERYDVILANPPFMSPKGGIKPHGKFGIKANRAEVLFVDYIASHLKPTGRAGIVVPEGIIFQSGKAYKELRKNLVDNYLYAVVSLPAGVFQPYSGVKTSVLLLDKELAKQRDEILFVKIENDGYSLGAQRRETIGNEFPEALELIKSFQNGKEVTSKLASAVPREKIAESDDYNLNGDRYKTPSIAESGNYPHVSIEKIAVVRKGSAITKNQINSGGSIPVVAGGQSPAYYHDVSNRDPDVITVSASGAYAGFVNYWTKPIFASDCSTIQAKDENTVMNRYLYETLKYLQNDIYKLQTGGGQPHVYPKDIQTIKIPLPPIETQREIVAELDSYQKIIDAAQTIVKTYKPVIDIEPEWDTVRLSSLIKELEAGVSVNSEGRPKHGDEKGILKTSAVTYGYFKPDENKVILDSELNRAKVHPRADSIIISRMNTPLLVGANAYVYEDREDLYLPDRLWQTVRLRNDFSMRYLAYVLSSPPYRKKIAGLAGGTSGSMKNVSKKALLDIDIPLPTYEVQNQIVTQLEAEADLIDSNKKLIDLYDKKIRAKIAELWGA